MTKDCNLSDNEIFQIHNRVMMQYSYKAGVYIFGKKAETVALKELKHLHTKEVMKPMSASKLINE